MNYFTVDIGGTFQKFAVMNEEGDFLAKDKIPSIINDCQKFLDSIEDQFHTYEKIYGKLAGIAISMAGVLDIERGYVFNAGSIRSVFNMNIASYFSERCGVPVTIENDAKAAAQAELWRGNLSDVSSGVVIVLGTGIGGAVIVDRKIVRGRHFFAGEFSYIMRGDHHNADNSNMWGYNGGARGLVMRTALKKNVPFQEMDGYKVFELVNDGDEETVEIFRDYCAGLAYRIWNLHAILDPDRILIGGGISRQEILLKTVREELDKVVAIQPYDQKAPEVMTCRFFNDSNMIGALYAHLLRFPQKGDSET